MKAFILLLVITAFIQTSFIPLNLVLILLICRSLIIQTRVNLILALAMGILIGILQAQNIGFWALVFLFTVKIVSLIKNLPVSKNILTIFIISSLLMFLVTLIESSFFKQTLNFQTIIIESILVIPLYFILLFWEERFVVQPETRLKLRN